MSEPGWCCPQAHFFWQPGKVHLMPWFHVARAARLMNAPLPGRGMFRMSCQKEGSHNEEYWRTAKPSGTARFPFGPCAVGESLGKHRREMYSIPMSRKPWKWANATKKIDNRGLIWGKHCKLNVGWRGSLVDSALPPLANYPLFLVDFFSRPRDQLVQNLGSDASDQIHKEFLREHVRQASQNRKHCCLLPMPRGWGNESGVTSTLVVSCKRLELTSQNPCQVVHNHL